MKYSNFVISDFILSYYDEIHKIITFITLCICFYEPVISIGKILLQNIILRGYVSKFLELELSNKYVNQQIWLSVLLK